MERTSGLLTATDRFDGYDESIFPLDGATQVGIECERPVDPAPPGRSGAFPAVTCFRRAFEELLRPMGPLEAWLVGMLVSESRQLQLSREDDSAAPAGRTDRVSVALGRLADILRLFETLRSVRREAGATSSEAHGMKAGSASGEAIPTRERRTLSTGSAGVFEDSETDAVGAESSTLSADHLWYGRLAFDTNTSATSPVVRGTGVTVRRVVSMVVDGYRWADILRIHPELDEDDIRACLAYCCEEEGGSLDVMGRRPASY